MRGGGLEPPLNHGIVGPFPYENAHFHPFCRPNRYPRVTACLTSYPRPLRLPGRPWLPASPRIPGVTQTARCLAGQCSSAVNVRVTFRCLRWEVVRSLALGAVAGAHLKRCWTGLGSTFTTFVLSSGLPLDANTTLPDISGDDVIE
jgi:hypothetical protein